MKSVYGCPVELSLDLLGGKWKTVILARLKQGAMGYGELRRAIPGLADKMLTQRLRDLEDDGLVARISSPVTGAGYALTQEGLSLAPVLEALYGWGVEAAGRKNARFARGARFEALAKLSGDAG